MTSNMIMCHIRPTCISQEEISQRVERWYKVFLMIDFGSYGSGVIISRGCVKFYPVAFFLNPRWPPKLHEISIDFPTIIFSK